MAELNTKESSENILQTIWYKFFPYWPLFVMFPALLLVLGFAISRYKKPTYLVAASLVITNDNNSSRAYANQPFQALNPFAATQVVDNEVLILQSRTLMKQVVKKLHLYAQVFEKRKLSNYAAFTTSPVIIEAQNPEKLKKTNPVYFEFISSINSVKIDGKLYELEKWTRFPFGTIRFIRNPHFRERTHRALFFTVQHPTIIAEEQTSNLKVASVSKLSSTINISYKSDVPELGEAIVNELLLQYVQSSIEHENTLAANSLIFVDDRLREVETELDSIERSVQNFRNRTGAIDLSEQSRIYLQNVSETDRRVSEIDAQLAILNQVDIYVSGGRLNSGVVPTNLGIEDPVLAELLNQLNVLELQLAKQRTITGENSPEVRSTENEIQKIRPNIQNIVKNQQSRLRASRNNLAATSDRVSSTIRNIPEQERELLEISRQQAVKKDLYAFLLQRREEAALSNASFFARNRVVDRADANVAKANSGSLIILAGCLLAGLVLAVAYIILKESFTRTVLFRSEVESQTKFRVISEIFQLKKPSREGRIPLYDAILSKEFNQLQAALGLFQYANSGRTILVTSSLLGEGSSYVCRNLAIQLASAGRKTLLLDLNLMKPDNTQAFHLGERKGFSNLPENMNDVQQIIHPSDIPELFIMPAGFGNLNSMSILLHPGTEEIMRRLKTQFDCIVIDSPPVQLSSEAFPAARFADDTLLIIRPGVTPKRILKKLDENVEINTLKNLSIVLNGIKPRGFPAKYFGYGYGFGHEMMPKSQLRKLSESA